MSPIEVVVLVTVVAILIAAGVAYVNRDRVKKDLSATEAELEAYLAKQKATYEKWAADEVALLTGKAKAAVNTVEADANKAVTDVLKK